MLQLSMLRQRARTCRRVTIMPPSMGRGSPISPGAARLLSVNAPMPRAVALRGGHEDTGSVRSQAAGEGEDYRERGYMMSGTVRRLLWGVGLCLVLGIALATRAQQTATSDSDVARQGALALAAAHGEQPRYGGTFLSAGNEEVPFYDLHQTSLGGIFAAVSPAYNCLIRTSPYDPRSLDLIPEF